MNRFKDSFSDVTISEALGDFQTTIQGIPKGPTDFNVTKAGTTPDMAVFHVGDQSGPPRRTATVGYRIYYTSIIANATTDLSDSTVRRGIYKAGKFVTSVDSQGNAATLTAMDSQFQGKKGWFTCVGVNRMNEESAALNICPSPWN